MKIKPKENYKLLGTDIKLSKRHWYRAIDATNQPEWKEKGKVFALLGGSYSNDSFLLERGEYTKQ